LGGLSLLLATGAAKPEPASALRVLVKPSKTNVRVGEPFKVALRVENATRSNRSVRVMSCTWYRAWNLDSDNASSGKIHDTNTNAFKSYENDAPVEMILPPGGAYTNEMELSLDEPTGQRKFSFRMSFTSVDGTQAFWSEKVEMNIVPPEHPSCWQRGTKIFRDRDGDGRIDWEVSGDTWRHDGVDTYKADTNYDGYYDVESAWGGITGGEYSHKSIHERVPKVGNDFVPIESPRWVP
jgi:hypothetical protein